MASEPRSAHPEEAAGNYKIPALRILSEITTSLSGESDLEDLLQRFLGTMMKLAGATAGAVRVLAADGAHLKLLSSLGLPAEIVERERFVPLSCGLCGQAAEQGVALSSTDLRRCAERISHPFFDRDCRKLFALPLCHKGKVLGVYNLFLPQGREIPEDVALLFRSIGEHLGMALENARLRRENMRITLMDERQMLANEIHDSLAQTLAYMKMRLKLLQDAVAGGDSSKSARYLNDTSQALDSAYSTLRELLTHFRSRMDPHGLLPALKVLAHNFYDKTGIMLDFSLRVPDIHLPVEQEVQVFHIVQEALANISRHSRAEHARLILDTRDGNYLITVEDDGIGAASAQGPGAASTSASRSCASAPSA